MAKVTTFLKGLFVSKPSDPGADEGATSTTSSQTQHASPRGKASEGVTSPQQPKAAPSPASPRPQVSSHSARAPPPKPDSIMLAVAPVLPPKMARPVWSLKDYAIVEKMYTGYASTVYKAWCKASGETVCLKSYNMSNLCELNRFQIFREIKLHSSLRHEHIIALYAAFQQGDQVVLVQEFAESGDLFLLLHRYGGKMPERTAVEMVLHPFLCVLHYLHQNCIVHRDIKPENVLFTRSMQLKLCDFGLAIDLREERAVTRAGTLEYMAPEVLDCPFKNKPEENKEKKHLHYNLTVDTWAVGVLTYELLVGFPPFNDKQKAAIEDKIRCDTPRFPTSMSELGRTFVLKALQKDALERPTIMELITHPWIKAHRRNASMRHLGTDKALLARQLAEEAAEVESSEASDSYQELQDPLTKLQNKMLKNVAAQSGDMRTVDGDLLRGAMPSYLSFTAGTQRPKLPLLSGDAGPKDKPPAIKAAPPAEAKRATPSAHITPTPPPGASPLSGGAGPLKGPLKDKRFAGLPEVSIGSAMSFSTSQNPRLQVLRGLAKGDHL